jgi:predicted dehydrogenase
VELAAICDVDPARIAQTQNEVDGAADAFATKDFREIIADDSIDTVSVTTPDHWHTPIALAALHAGKHAHVEKPCSHTIHEGRVLTQTAQKRGMCVQHGTQSRSGEGIRRAIQDLHDGIIGKVRLAKAINHQLRPAIGRAPETDPPEGVDYDRWLGPAPVRPFTQNRWHYNWHWHWDYGTGDMGNDGVHQVDVARWGLNVGWPKGVTATGGQLFYDDDHETPDTQVVTFDYGGAYLVFEMRLWTNYTLEGHDNGVVFYGDNGKVDVGRAGCFVTRIGEKPEKIGGSHDLTAHVANFVSSVQAGDPSKLNAPIAEGEISAGLCHLGNIATRLGRGLMFDPDNVSIVGDDEAAAMLTKPYRAGYEMPAHA